MPRNGGYRHDPKPDATMRSFCWCGKQYVWVTAEQVRNGETDACNRPGCGPDNMGTPEPVMGRRPNEDW